MLYTSYGVFAGEHRNSYSFDEKIGNLICIDGQDINLRTYYDETGRMICYIYAAQVICFDYPEGGLMPIRRYHTQTNETLNSINDQSITHYS